MFNRICQVRLVKMRETDKNNGKLLEMDGSPGKIYLDGFLPHEFVRTTNLITKHGGIVMLPDDETIILSKESDSRDATNQPRFHVQWLHDCIRDNELLDIGKYLLPRAQASPQKAILPETSAFDAKYEKTIDKQLSKTLDDNYKMYEQPEDIKTGRYRGPETEEKSIKINTSNKRNSSPFKFVDDLINSEEENTSVEEEKSQFTRKKGESSRIRSGRIVKAYSILQKNRKSSNSKKQGDVSFKSRISKNSRDPTFTCSTMEEDMEPESSNDAEINSLKESIESIENRSSEGGMESWKDGESSEREIEKMHHDHSLEKNTSKTLRRGRYSKEETQYIMKYIDENNLLSRTRDLQIWKELSATEMFLNRGRSSHSLRRHYRRIITENDEEYSVGANVTDKAGKKDRKKLKHILRYFNVNADNNDINNSDDDEENHEDDHEDHDDDHNASDDSPNDINDP